MDPTTPADAPADAPNLEAKLEEMQKAFEASQSTIAQQKELIDRAQAALQAVVEEKANQPAGGANTPNPPPRDTAGGEPPPWFTGWAQQFAQNVEARFGQLGAWREEQEFSQLVQTAQPAAEVEKIARELREQQMKLGRPINAKTALTHARGIYAEQQEIEQRKAAAARNQFNVPMPTFGAPRGYQPPGPQRPVFKNDAEQMAWLEQAVGDQPLGGH